MEEQVKYLREDLERVRRTVTDLVEEQRRLLGELARRQGLELTFGYHNTNKLVEGWYIHKKDVEKP